MKDNILPSDEAILRFAVSKYRKYAGGRIIPSNPAPFDSGFSYFFKDMLNGPLFLDEYKRRHPSSASLPDSEDELKNLLQNHENEIYLTCKRTASLRNKSGILCEISRRSVELLIPQLFAGSNFSYRFWFSGKRVVIHVFLSRYELKLSFPVTDFLRDNSSGSTLSDDISRIIEVYEKYPGSIMITGCKRIFR